MTKSINPIFSLLLVSLFFTSCNGQTNTNRQTDNVNLPISSPTEHPKMLKSQGKYTHRTATGPYSEEKVIIREIFEDKNGNIWVATMGEGVYRFDGKSFINYTANDGLITNLVYTIMEDLEGNIWFGTTDGVSRYNGKTFTNFPFSIIKGNANINIANKSIEPLKEPFNQYKEVWSILQDKTGKIWFGTTDGVYRFDGKTFTSIADLDTSKNKNLKHITVTSIAEDKEGNIWFTSWADGLCRFDGKSITKISPNGEGFNSMLLDRNGNFWLGKRDNKEGGVYCFDGKIFAKQFVGMPFITEMKEDKSGNIWFSNVPNGGMIYYNPSTSEIISRFTTENGLRNNQVTAVSLDKSGNVWFGMSDLTLTRYDGKTFTNF